MGDAKVHQCAVDLLQKTEGNDQCWEPKANQHINLNKDDLITQNFQSEFGIPQYENFNTKLSKAEDNPIMKNILNKNFKKQGKASNPEKMQIYGKS